MTHVHKSKEEIENSVFFPIDIATKFRGNKHFFNLWSFLLGFETLSASEFSKMHKKGLVERHKNTVEEAINFLKLKSPQKLNNPNFRHIFTCHWCKGESYLIHKHHHPVSKKDGGKETVNICPNCHCEFHFLIRNYQYKPIKEIEDAFEKSKEHKIKTLKEIELEGAK